MSMKVDDRLLIHQKRLSKKSNKQQVWTIIIIGAFITA